MYIIPAYPIGPWWSQSYGIHPFWDIRKHLAVNQGESVVSCLIHIDSPNLAPILIAKSLFLDTSTLVYHQQTADFSGKHLSGLVGRLAMKRHEILPQKDVEFTSMLAGV